jgi:hypothetical protein
MPNPFNNKLTIYLVFFSAFIIRLLKVVPNLELVTLSMLLASTYLSRNSALKLTFLLMAASDLVLGNTNIFIFTWSGFLIPVLLISKYKNILKIVNCKLKIINILAVGIGSNLFFYTWTNLGVWLLDSWGMYPKTAAGLIQCYINGLPFLRNQLASTFLFVPLGFILFNWFKLHLKDSSWNLSLQS